jgi:predicted lipoprotein with Yx(FWY)xxD motif
MTTRLLAATAVAVALGVAACGGSGWSSSSTTPPTSTTVAVKPVSGVGKVLVDSAGKALYSSSAETGGKVLCTGACTSFWKPLTVGSGMPTAAAGAGKLAVIKRPDGTRQVALNGKPLYTFAQDTPGKVQGNGFSDQFAGHRFTWSAVLAGGSASSSSGSTTSTPARNGYGY